MSAAARSPLVSVVMSMRNSAATVAAAVRSVLQQSFADFELIVIDNGSSDRSGAIVESFDDPRIRLIREAATSSLAVRLNQAVALSRGEFIARMDADDICFPERLARQLALLRENPSLDLIGCRAVVFTSAGALLGELPVGGTHPDVVARPFASFPLPHPTWCGRADWFRNNPYSSDYAEDQDLLLRSFRHTTFGAVDEVLLAYRQDQLALRKLLRGRATYMGALWRYGLATHEVLPVVAGMTNHVVKGIADIATLGLGFARLMQRQRLEPIGPSVAQQWRELQQAFLSSADRSGSSGPRAA